MNSEFTVILVPQGKEHQSVRKAIGQSKSPRIIPIPIGRACIDFCKNIKIEEKSILLLGVAGSLSPEINTGEVVSYKTCSFWNSLSSSSSIQCNLVKNAKIQPVDALTTDQVICKATQKSNLAQYGQIVDMESYHILQIFKDKPVSIIRVISDNAKSDIPDLNLAINHQGEIDPWKLIITFCKEPRASLRLIIGSLKALDKLTQITRELFN